jgi:putative transposase
VAGSWPVWGRIGTVHCDNAKEFRGVVLERGCAEHGIDLSWRPVKTPRYGGHIERMMGTVAREMHKLPGTTFANTRDRKGYDSEAEATLTLREVERHLAEFFVNVYHQRMHSELGMSPIRKWELGLVGDATKPGLGLMPLPHDPERILLDFMPYVERTVQPYGLQIDKINYYDPVLDPYINAIDAAKPDEAKSKRMFIIRRHPGDISRVYFFDPAAQRYCVIPYRNLAHPAMSLYELREVRRRLEAEGRRDVDEELIFQALERMRARIDEAQQKSKAARRHANRSPRPAPRGAPGSHPLMSGIASKPAGTPPPAATVEADPFSEPIRPFEELALKR